MPVYSVYIVSKSGGLIFHSDFPSMPRIEVEKTFSYPLDMTLSYQNVLKRVVVVFGQRDGVCVGHAVMAVNGVTVNGRLLEDGRDVEAVVADEANYPLSIRFGRPRLTTNERIVLASTFHSFYAIASQLSPEPKSSGIEVLEAGAFRLHCYQTVTGIKFIVLADARQASLEPLLRRLFELYADYALKNPFYSLEMPIRCELFDTNLQAAVEQMERTGISNV
uniref:Trafficking protein particle complex subunit n=1 Tax=Rhipicephalus pulchellus TaxID=72859 RepID=L7M539_RHIPC